MPGMRDDGIEPRGPWTFKGTAPNFDQHVAGSVPLYHEGHELTTSVLDFVLGENGGTVVDLGCSTGALLARVAADHCTPGRRVGLDCDPGMIEEAKRQHPDLEFKVADIRGDWGIADKPKALLAYYTLQFLEIEQRETLVRHIWDRLATGGVFVLFEKTVAETGWGQELHTALYDDFKQANGYTPEQREAKTRSLRGALKPLSLQENFDMLRHAGFDRVATLCSYGPFVGLAAFK